MVLSEKLKEFRRNEGLTQKELAMVLDSSQNTISQYESGKRTPTVKKLLEISTLIGCSVNELTTPFVDSDTEEITQNETKTQ